MARFGGMVRGLWRRRAVRYTVFAIGAMFIIGLGTIVGFIAAAAKGLPSLSGLEPNPALTSFIYDANGDVIAEISGWENRIPVPLSQVPQSMVDAFVASEDIRFWKHYGIDLRGILRAAYRDIRGASIQEGASTITQQFARNAFGLGFERSWRRKLQEAILSIQIERQYTKEEILEMYLNQIWFGHSAYGVQAAAKIYFGKDVSELNLPESALICAIARNGNLYSPYINADRAHARRNLVLDQMVRYGMISSEEGSDAKATPLNVTGLPTETYPAAYFVDYVLKYLLERFSSDTVYRGGLRIYTTLDMRLQNLVEQAYVDILDEALPLYGPDGERLDQPQSAAVFLDPETGAIRAMLGGREHEKRLELNRALPPRGSWAGTLRQPGSAFKPIAVYAPAIELGWSASSVLDDAVKTWHFPMQDPWGPENYNHLYRGLTTFRRALELSINTVAVKALEQIGVETGVRYAQRFGIDSLVTEGRLTDSSLAVGLGGLTHGVSVLDMAQAYSVFANGGIRVEPFGVIRVEDRFGNVIAGESPQREVVLSEQAAYIVTDMLKGVVTHGTGTRAAIGRPAAGKTGTTDMDFDAWYVGYTPELVAALWMGYDQPKSMNDIFGGTYLAPIWRQIMRNYLEGQPVRDWREPAGIIRMTVCTKSGLLPGPHCPTHALAEELFIEGRQPLATCNVHATAVVCAQRPWLLAGPHCTQPITKTFIRRSEPFEIHRRIDPRTADRMMTFIPEDAADDYPTRYCDLHGAPDLPPYPGPTQEVVIAAYRYSFSPDSITVPLGTRLTVKVQAQDTNHGFAVPAFGVDEICLKGQQTTITFICDQVGTFTFYSSVFSGRDVVRMTGTLTVTEN